MKLNGNQALGLFRRPDLRAAGILVYGSDDARTRYWSDVLVDNVIGKDGVGELRLTRMPAASLRTDQGGVLASIKARSFFPGHRVTLIEGARETHLRPIRAATEGWTEGDAMIVAVAGILPVRSRLRKHFENEDRLRAAPVYANAMTWSEVREHLTEAGVGLVSSEAERQLLALGQSYDLSSFRRIAEKLALYKHGDNSGISSADIDAVVSGFAASEIDALLGMVADGPPGRLCIELARSRSLRISPAGLCTAAKRFFLNLYKVTSDRNGPVAACEKLRPPVFGPRRDAMIRRARRWDAGRCERALQCLADADLAIRSEKPLPSPEVVERALLHIAVIGRRRGA